MKQIYKHLSLALAMIMCCHFVFAQNIVEHTVKRGETLSHIAQKYDTTEEAIREANPQYGDYFYVGMKLTIPADKTVNKELSASVNEEGSSSDAQTFTSFDNGISQKLNYENQTYSDSTTQIAESDNVTNCEYDKLDFTATIAYGLVPKTEGVSSSNNFTYAMTAGINYNISKSFYVGARIGYSLAHTNTSYSVGIGSYHNTTTDTHMLTLPVETGYKLYLVKDKVALIPYLGLDVNCGLKCKIEQKDNYSSEKKNAKIKDRFGVNGRIGVRFNLWGFDIGCAYLFPFNDTFGDNSGFPEISIAFGF